MIIVEIKKISGHMWEMHIHDFMVNLRCIIFLLIIYENRMRIYIQLLIVYIFSARESMDNNDAIVKITWTQKSYAYIIFAANAERTGNI